MKHVADPPANTASILAAALFGVGVRRDDSLVEGCAAGSGAAAGRPCCIGATTSAGNAGPGAAGRTGPGVSEERRRSEPAASGLLEAEPPGRVERRSSTANVATPAATMTRAALVAATLRELAANGLAILVVRRNQMSGASAPAH